MRRLKRTRQVHLLVAGFVTVAGLGIAGAILNSDAKVGSSGSASYTNSGLIAADPLSFDATNLGVQSYSTGASDSAPIAAETSDSGAIVPPASLDSAGSTLVFSELPSFVVADPARVAAFRTESDDREGSFRPGQPQPSATPSPSVSGRSSPYASAGGGSFGGGGGGLGGAPSTSGGGGGHLDSGVANSTSGEDFSVEASGRHAGSPLTVAAGALSSPPGLLIASDKIPSTATAHSVFLPSPSVHSLVGGNSATSSGASASAQTLQVAQVPEPSTLILLAAGLGFAARRRRP